MDILASDLHKKECNVFTTVLGHHHTWDLWVILANLQGLEAFFSGAYLPSFPKVGSFWQASKE